MSKKKTASRQAYSWPPKPDPDYVTPKKNPIHSVLTALPILMLVAGLYYYYSGEKAQNSGVPIEAESIEIIGRFKGLSSVNSGSTARYYLWVDTDTRARGPRVTSAHAQQLEVLLPGEEIRIRMAPTVEGSKTLWAYKVYRDNVDLLGTLDDTSQ